MKLHTASLSLLIICCLVLAVGPAMASVPYSNGPYNGTADAWTINFGFSVSNSFSVAMYTQGTGFEIVYWDASTTDVLTTVDMSIGTTSFGSNISSGTYGTFSNTFLGINQYGYALYDWRAQTGLIMLPSAGYITLQNACTTSGCSVSDPIYWDENSGIGCTSPGCPSTAYENTLGSIPSEAFTLLGACCGATPEPSSIMLFGSGILGLAGVLRWRRNI